MIPKQTILEIQQLVTEGTFSHRKIALRVGVSRGTVNNVASGKRTVYTIYQSSRDKDAPEGQEHHTRCPVCGARVLKPCLACLLKTLPRHLSEHDAPLVLGLDLLPEHHERYLKIRVARELQQRHEEIV